jgi:T5SS/PEP-CTERM-associated repeat protein
MSAFSWFGGDGDLGVASNWSGQPDPSNPTTPQSGDDVTIGGSGVLTGSGSYNSVDFTGDLTLAGAINSTVGALLGRTAGSTDMVTVDGAGSSLSGGGVMVGYAGSGTLTVQNGGAVGVSWLQEGAGQGSTGTVTVDGVGSSLTSESIMLGGLGPGPMSQNSGALTVENGGAVATTYLDVGFVSTGTLTVESGGAIATAYLEVGDWSGSRGTVMIEGVGSKLTVSSDLTFAANGGSGGEVTVTGAGSMLTIGGALGGAGVVTLGAGATLEIGGAVSSEIHFAGQNALLRLDSAAQAGGLISGFATTDEIDLAHVTLANVAWDGGHLALTTSDNQTITLDLGGLSPGVLFAWRSDGAGGTDLSISPYSLVVNGGVTTPIGSAGAHAVGFTLAGLGSADTGVVTFSDGDTAVTVNVDGAHTSYTADLSMLGDGTITTTLQIANQGGGPIVGGFSLDQDLGEQAGLGLRVNGGAATPIGTAGAKTVAFTVAGLDAEESGLVTFTDAAAHTVTVAVDGAHMSYKADLSTLVDGTITSMLQVATDAAGNGFQPVTGNDVTLDQQPPAAPSGLSDAAIVGGYVNAAHQASSLLTGVAEAGATITLYDHGGTTALATTTADAASGAFSIDLSTLADGAHSLTVTATDAAGNTGPASAPLAFTVNSLAPAAPAGLADAAIVGGYVSAAHDTASQMLTGNADAGAVVTVYDGSAKLGTATASNTGAWSYRLGHLGDGAHSLTATVTNTLGNIGASNPLAFTVDTHAPAAPTGLADAAVVKGYVDAVNDTAAMAVTGTAEAGATITVYDRATKLGTATADAVSGAWSFTLGELANGTHRLTATASDAAGNVGGASSVLAFTVDTAAPAAPTLADTAIIGGYVNAAHDLATQKLTGAAEKGATVTLYDNGSQLATVTAGATGAWSYSLGHLSDGAHSLTATATDAAGNVGPASEALAFTVDTVGPLPVVTQFATTAAPVFAGTSEPGSTVVLTRGGTKVGTDVTSSDGTWSIAGKPLTGAAVIKVAATDAAGNVAKTFDFVGALGERTVTGFAPGVDHLQIAGALEPPGFSDSWLQQHETTVGGATVITFDSTDAITLSRVSATSLHASNFLFV